jgi:2-hydroxy-3-oxopropionate reductase
MKTIALLGTGIMGAPMTRNLAAAGFTMRVWNRTMAKAEALSDVATVCPTAAEAIMNADAVITMLENGAVVTEVLFGALSAAKAGTLFIDMSSIEPSVARDHADALESQGMRHLDAPVSGGEKGATDATLAIMAGGDAGDFADAKPLFAAMGHATHVGIHGAGQVAKLANQVIVGITIGAVSEALMLAQEGGCDPAAVREALMGGFATSKILDLHGQRMLDRNWVPGAPAAIQLKDMDNALAAAAEYGLKLPLTELAREAFADLAADPTLARNDHSAYLRWLEIQNPTKRLGKGEDQLP